MRDIEKLLERMKSYQTIIVFGIGNVSNAFTETFKVSGLSSKIKYYAISDIVPDNSYFHNVPIKQIDDLTKYNDSALIIIATADKYYFEIEKKLKFLNFQYIMDFTFESRNWSILRERYFIDFFCKRNEKFSSFSYKKLYAETNLSVHDCKIFMIKSCADSEIKNKIDIKYAKYLLPLQVGKALTNLSIASYQDNVGDNISNKNENYCELTGLYWIWKNISAKWVGICHYRRHFELTKADINMIMKSKYDVVLPIPIVNIPSVVAIYENDHQKSDWEIMMSVLNEKNPDYYDVAKDMFQDIYYCAYNMMIAKKNVFDDYCAWLFPLLFEIERRTSKVRDDKYQKRYIGFLAERLTSLYFMYNQKNLNVLFVHKIFYR